MRRGLVVLVLLLAACGIDAPDNTGDWLRVLHHKKVAAAPSASAQDKQVYADSLAAFVHRHPTHSRARQVYERIQLDFASELASLGRYHDAVHFYRAVLAHDPANAQAIRGLNDALEHLSVTRAKLLQLHRGMTQSEVSHVLGKPVPGWTLRRERNDTVIDSWYYRKVDGGVAGVYFRDGELFAAEENSHARLAPLTSGLAR